jgi:hypothetical protein
MLFLQCGASLAKDGELKEKNNIYNTNQHNEFRQRVLLFHLVIRCPDSCSFSLIFLQFFPLFSVV